MASSNLQSLYQQQYEHGEWAGPKWYQHLRPFIKTREERVAQLIPQEAATLLDIGCGEGNLFEQLPNSIKTAHGIDLLKSRLEIAKKKFPTELKSHQFTFSAVDVDVPLPFPNQSFSVVTCISALEYIIDPRLLVTEVHRVLKDGGTFILEVPNLAYIGERVRLLTGHLVGVAQAPGWQGGRLHHFTFASLEAFLQACGFQIRARAASGLLWKFRELYPALLSSDIILVCEKK